ncbi:hypothetical protein, conserved [Trypanosoma brucei brucei TREU927]|uniref:Importin N-terminal domain-containing protein n=1 Tax=Trypanosoma brucei brucei (strain 927/4 GUTat10.1) TaxID=185431 RepID=Q381F2_TRYB2|nr:hypothetical protein, conserved [Trypanosoma brucei brucei TREU927]EAN80579.1 hypothetical protein, conserved [Trypanosoma brucei brucei TREU927]
MTTAASEGIVSREQLQMMLHVILHSTDNNERRNVEKSVVQLLTTPSTLTLLMVMLRDVQGSSPGVRQLAAVLLRKKVLSLWRTIPSESRGDFKGALLEQLGCEPVKAVRLALAHLVTRVAKADAMDEDGGWPELNYAIRAAVIDPRAEMRELAMVLAYSVAEVMSEADTHCLPVVEAVLQGMLDSEDAVQRSAVKAVGTLFVFIRGQTKVWEQLLQQLVPQCLALLTKCGTEETKTNLCVDVLDLLEQLVEDLSVKKHGALLRSVALEVLSVMTNGAIQPRVRQSCAEVLASLVNQKPKFVSTTVLEPLVSACVQVMSEDNAISLPEVAHTEGMENCDDSQSDENDAADMLHVDPPCLFAGRLLSTIATKVAAKSFTGALLPLISPVAQSPQAVGPKERKASILALACLAEGNPGYLRRRVRYVLEFTQQLLSDSEPVPREAAAFALIYFCLHLQPEILTHHEQLFPMLVPLLRDEVDAVRRRAACALDTLCENLAGDVEPHVSVLLPAVLEAIGCSSLQTQSELCGVIASLATTQCASFKQHAGHCLELLKPPLTMTSPETILLRARATETAGVVAAAMGRETFMPHLSFFMEQVAENLRTRQPQLREESFGFLSNICELLRGDFIPYLDDTINCALQTIAEDRAHYENKHLLAGGAMPHFKMDDECNTMKAVIGGDEVGDDDNDDDKCCGSDGSDAEEIHGRVRTADLEEKSSAVYFVGVCAEVLMSSLGTQRIDACWAALADLDVHFHSNIRCSTLLALAKLTQAVHGSECVIKDTALDTLAPAARERLNTLVNETLLPCIRGEGEEDKEVVAAACDAFELLFKFFGPQLFLADTSEFLQIVTRLLQQRMPYQREDEDDDASDSSDGEATGAAGSDGDQLLLGEDHDGVLMDAVCEMVEAFAKAYGPGFRMLAEVILPLLLPYASLDRPSEDVVMATGSIASILESLGPEAAPFVDHAVTLALELISSTDESTARANCAYMIRVLVESCSGRFNTEAAATPLLQALWLVVGGCEEIPAAVDNAISAICSMVRCLSPGVVPLATVVPSILGGLPMRVDRSENANAIRTLVHILDEQREFVVTQCWVEMAQCIAKVLASPTVEEKQKHLLVNEGIKKMLQSHGQKWRETCPQFLSAELLSSLERYGCC